MQTILNFLLVALMVVLGGVPTLYIVISLPAVLIQKIVGKIKYGKSLYD